MGGIRSPIASSTLSALQGAREALLGGGKVGLGRSVSMFDADVISFAHGEGVRRPYPEAIAAIARALANPEDLPIENYMFLHRSAMLEAAIAADMAAIGVPAALAANVVLEAGTTRLIIAALELLTEPGDTVVTFSGFYHPLASWCAYRNLELRVVPTVPEEDHLPSATRLEEVLATHGSARPPVLLLFNPTMTGAICGPREVRAIAEVLARREMWAIEDALFANCEYEETARSARLAATPVAERVLTVSGASKLHGLANMRIGWGCGSHTLVDALRDFVTSNAASIPHLAKVAALEALRAPEAFTRRNVREVRDRLELLANTIGEIDMRLRAASGQGVPLVRIAHVPKAGHSLLLDFDGFAEAARRHGLTFADSADLTRWFLNTCKVAFSPAQSHGFGGFHLRANVASIGTALTYPASRAVEQAWDGAWSPAHAAAYEPGFAEGRAMITTALTGRVEPAMRRALGVAADRSSSSTKWSPTRAHGFREAVSGCDVVLMDVWGVLTDGTRLFDGALPTLERLAETNRPTVLVSNTSRRGHHLAEKLAALGLPRRSYTSIVTGGDLAFDCAVARRVGARSFGGRVFLIGEQPGGHWAEEAGLVPVAEMEEADLLLGVGVLEGELIDERHLDILRRAAARDLPFLVSNADSRVRLGDRIHVAIGALAPHYQSLGGEAHVFGKPYRAIFAAAVACAAAQLGCDALEPNRVLAVGDSLATDIAGAGALGARTLLVTATGVHQSELHPGPQAALCADALARLCNDHMVRPDLIVGAIAW